MDRRAGLFTALIAGCALVAAVAVGAAIMSQRGHRVETAGKTRTVALARPYLVFRSLNHDKGPAGFGTLTTAQLGDAAGTRRQSGLQCERVYAAASSGLCLVRAGTLIGGYKAKILGPGLQARGDLPLSGVPSRARVSPDGRYGATTTFVSGHSYAQPGKFSTATNLIDMRRGKEIGNLEDFKVTYHRRVLDSPNLNFWGVTFARDSDRFYATMATGGRAQQIGNQGGTHLIEGSVSKRTAKVIHDNVECPSLSPDGTRIGYKKLVGRTAVWRFHVLDLATGKETPLAEVRPVDDQLEWL